MKRLESTLRDWKVTLEPIADRKPRQLNDISDVEARATPPMMGICACTQRTGQRLHLPWQGLKRKRVHA